VVGFADLGDILVGNGSSGQMVDLAVGTDGDPLISNSALPLGIGYGTLLQRQSIANFNTQIVSGLGWTAISGPNTANVSYLRIGRFVLFSVDFNSTIFRNDSGGSAPFTIIGNITATAAPSWAVLPANKNPQTTPRIITEPGPTAFTGLCALRRGGATYNEWAVGQATSALSPFAGAIWAALAELSIPYFAVSWMDES
jgi:hypothetical protein